jgi:uncharacterized protein
MTELQTPLLDLFEQMRSVGIPLTVEQYDLLRRSLAKGYGLGDWDALRRVCRLVWYRPGGVYEKADFDQVLDEYIQSQQSNVRVWLNAQLEKLSSESTSPPPEPLLGLFPPIPPRKKSQDEQKKMPQPGASDTPEKAPSAVKDEPNSSHQSRQNNPQYMVQDLPISVEVVQKTWRSLRRPVADERIREIDLDATIEKLGREGIFSDVVERSVRGHQTELVLLMDDGSAMVPYRPIWEPLVRAVERRLLGEVPMYRFTGYPSRYLYLWHRPMQSVAIASFLTRLHPSRSVVVIVSEGGAASQRYDESKIAGMAAFLRQLKPCVREILWLNPVPQELWRGTSMEEIQIGLGRLIVPFDSLRWQALAQELSRGGRR